MEHSTVQYSIVETYQLDEVITGSAQIHDLRTGNALKIGKKKESKRKVKKGEKLVKNGFVRSIRGVNCCFHS